MARYTVEWGVEERTVEADSEQEAWNQFAMGVDLALRHPHLNERTITVIDENEETDPVLPAE